MTDLSDAILLPTEIIPPGIIVNPLFVLVDVVVIPVTGGLDEECVAGDPRPDTGMLYPRG